MEYACIANILRYNLDVLRSKKLGLNNIELFQLSY